MISPIKKLKDDDNALNTINISSLVGKKSESYNPSADLSPDNISSSTKKKSSTRKVNMTKSNKKSESSFYDKYSETNSLLNQTIYEIDELNSGLKQELKNVMTSKTLKKKYEYMSELAGTSSNLLSTKITAIRELNKSITDSTSLEIRLAKETKKEEETDDKRIMDMYNAFINTPVGTYAGPIAPTTIDMNMSNTGTTIMTGMSNDDVGFNDYMNNLTPEERKIHLERQSNIKTVVVFDPETGHRYFDNVDMDTGKPVPGLPLPEAQFLDDLNINQHTGVARNTNLNITYPLVIKRSAPSFEDF